MGMAFLDDRDEDQNAFLLGLSRTEIVRSAVAAKVIIDDDLAMVPEVVPVLARLAGSLRDDIYEHHNRIQKPLQFPLIATCFSYSFAKGAEAAFLWNESPDGRIEFSYLFEDALRGAAGADVTDHFTTVITKGMDLSYSVFVDFQDHILVDPRFGLAMGGRFLADMIACGFFWSSQIGLDYGMHHLGFE